MFSQEQPQTAWRAGGRGGVGQRLFLAAQSRYQIHQAAKRRAAGEACRGDAVRLAARAILTDRRIAAYHDDFFKLVD